MFRRNLYYAVKPLIPIRWRRIVRGYIARRRLRDRAVQAVWPILESAGAVPPDWRGWSDGKSFAFVLTHDVEGPEGLAKVRPLAELEMGLGFRSSFNFIPEGDYSVPEDLRSWLVSHGFEVGVHDLHHNGKLYRSREAFRRNAEQINRYLHEWRAVGYRSGFMLHNYAWHHDLDVVYDASSFDTDPFEPQPDGVGTIFPFFVPREESQSDGQTVRQSNGRSAPRPGYVELPYTLPQDSTLFFLLGETSDQIWRKKLAWIAEKGGMALLNTHPDYMGFAGEQVVLRRTFNASLYAGFLRHVREEYAGQYTHLLPRQVATHHLGQTTSSPVSPSGAARLATTDPAPIHRRPLAGKRAAVLLYSYYPSDPRPRRAALAMAEAGAEVDFICLRGPRQFRNETVDGIHVRRISVGKARGSKLSYLLQYGSFITACFSVLATRVLQRRYDLVHVHNMPDILVFAALPAKLRGARVIIDLHDPMPELMTAIYNLRPEHGMVRMLRRFERWSLAFADLAFTPNITFKRLFVSRGCPEAKMQIIMNSPQQSVFDPDRFAPGDVQHKRNGVFRVMHHGSIVHRHGVDLLVEAVASLRNSIPGIRLDIYGSRTSFLDVVLDTAKRAGAADIVHFHGEKSLPEIAAAIRECDLGVVPNRRSAFTETNFPTRLFEYLAMQRPVLAPSTEGIRDYFQETDMLYFDPDAPQTLAERIAWAYNHRDALNDFVARGAAVYRRHLWREEKQRLVNMTQELLHR